MFASCECGAEGPDGTLDSACDWIAAHCLSLLCDLDEAGLRVAARLAPDFTGTLDELISTARAIAA
ncbi:hypothetical protein [Blastococcus mobilis]|uniref:hypothetical protein n=1 Tax=Blastococcus mobilis TaxID=1938746 RepID=UPI001595B610|nr:hypothetical protein [Blastococcus mobilis]